MRPNILVTGGAGYIGSHICKALYAAGYMPVVFDDLSNGHKEAVQWGPLEIGNILDKAALKRVCEKYKPIAAMHFAALIEVGESVNFPDKFWLVNVQGLNNVLVCLQECAVDVVVFSSTCAIFEESSELLTENHVRGPVSPYASTKLACEMMLQDFNKSHGIRSTALRYFNAAGADLAGEIGENHNPESHLIPIACEAAFGKRSKMAIYGTDYPTPDGTCLRDYIHVQDLASAHVLALKRLLDGAISRSFNLGNGQGYSVREVIDTVKAITERDFEVEISPRRAGDSPRLVGNSERARKELGWQPKLDDLDVIVKTAWQWHREVWR